MAPRVDEPNVFHYTKDQHAHSILNTARIKFTDLSSPGNDIHELRGIVQEYQVVKDLVDRFVQYLGTKDRFLCGCASADVHSAWVTYANGYRGVCLGFAVKPEYRFPVSYTAIPHDVDSLTREAMARSRQLSVLRELVRQIKFGAIDYDEAVERIVRYAVDWANIQVLLRQVLSTKSTEWVHEKEIRIGLAVQSLGSDSSAKVVGEGFRLQEVIAGPLMVRESFNELRDVVVNFNELHNVDVKLSRLVPSNSTSYRLARQDDQ